MTDARYRPGFQGIAIHDAGIQLMGLITGIHRADPGIKQRTLFKQSHGFSDHIQRALSRFQHLLADVDNVGKRLDIA